MHTYRKSGKDNEAIWTVGFEQYAGGEYIPWRAIKDFKHELAAAAFASFLNGGAWPAPGILTSVEFGSSEPPTRAQSMA